jgi:hypothetical protein
MAQHGGNTLNPWFPWRQFSPSNRNLTFAFPLIGILQPTVDTLDCLAIPWFMDLSPSLHSTDDGKTFLSLHTFNASPWRHSSWTCIRSLTTCGIRQHVVSLSHSVTVLTSDTGLMDRRIPYTMAQHGGNSTHHNSLSVHSSPFNVQPLINMVWYSFSLRHGWQ